MQLVVIVAQKVLVVLVQMQLQILVMVVQAVGPQALVVLVVLELLSYLHHNNKFQVQV